jgi:hypothetical protein
MHNYKLTMVSQLGKCRNRIRSDGFITIQQGNERWNGRPNFLAKLNFTPALERFWIAYSYKLTVICQFDE